MGNKHVLKEAQVAKCSVWTVFRGNLADSFKEGLIKSGQ